MDNLWKDVDNSKRPELSTGFPPVFHRVIHIPAARVLLFARARARARLVFAWARSWAASAGLGLGELPTRADRRAWRDSGRIPESLPFKSSASERQLAIASVRGL